MRINETIIVRSDLKVGKLYGKVEFYPGMRHLLNEEGTISEIVTYEKMDLLTQLQLDKETKVYHLKEDPAGYLWSKEMFELDEDL